VVSFGNSGSIGEDESIADKLLGGEFSEVVDRYGLTWDLEKLEADLLSGRIDFENYYLRLLELAEEISYDMYVGYNPFTYHAGIGGIYLNGEIRTQARSRRYGEAVGIRTAITEVQLEAMLDFYQYQNWFNMLSCNCTYSAATAWNIATCANPDYHLDPNFGSYSSAISAPMFLKEKILLQSTSLRYDENVTCYSSIGVIKPEAMAQPGTYGGTEIKPLFGNLKSNLTFQIVMLNTGETYEAKKFGAWESSDWGVVTVTGNGYMKAWSSGVAFVTCSADLKYFGYLVLVI